MKKNILLCLLALLLCTIGYAQEYKMVVELNDGTKISLNTNDVKELSFSEGKLVVSGGSLTEKIDKISQESSVNYNSLSSSIKDIINQNARDKEELLNRIKELENKLDAHINNTGNSEAGSNPLVGTWRAEVKTKEGVRYWDLTFTSDFKFSYKDTIVDTGKVIETTTGTYSVINDIVTINADGFGSSAFTINGDELTFSKWDHGTIYKKITNY